MDFRCISLILSLTFLLLGIYSYDTIYQNRVTHPMDTQQALILKDVQRPLVLGRRPVPQPKGNQILVRIIAAGSTLPDSILSHERGS